ncbi:MAG: hypothetical protein ACI8RD_004041 [Bacillariaceae sp.]|jgi:hypothetical protein
MRNTRRGDRTQPKKTKAQTNNLKRHNVNNKTPHQTVGFYTRSTFELHRIG